MIADEADWQITQPILFWKTPAGVENFTGDTKAEESSWNGMLMQAATVMLPRHPHRGAWRARCIQLMASAYSRQEDLTSGQIIDGAAIGSYLDGWNINSDGTVVNHGFIHPDYAGTVVQNLQAVCLFSIARQPVPQAATVNAALIYSSLTGRVFASPPFDPPGGTVYVPGSADLYFPQGNDWGTSRKVHMAALDAMVDSFGIAAGADGWGLLHAQAQAAMQARSTTGQTYIAGGEDNYAGREQWVAMNAAWAWLARWVVAAGRYRP
jgi:hypothetical protein